MAVSSYQSIFDYIRSRVPGVEVNSNGTLRIRGGNGVVLITTKMAYEEQQQRIKISDLETYCVLKNSLYLCIGRGDSKWVRPILSPQTFPN